MKSDYEDTLDKNFEKALTLCSKSYSYENLIEFLKSGNIPEKQYAALVIEELKTPEDAEIFISNLINCDGKIREAVAQKFLELCEQEVYCDYFSDYPEILAKATIDINANISRMVIDGLSKMKDFKIFGEKYTDKLIRYIDEAFDGLDKIVFKDKKYTINKQLFKLYWCLEGLNNYSNYISASKLKKILKIALNRPEYTVREKVAQILKNLPENDFSELILKVKSDDNYYVRKILTT